MGAIIWDLIMATCQPRRICKKNLQKEYKAIVCFSVTQVLSGSGLMTFAHFLLAVNRYRGGSPLSSSFFKVLKKLLVRHGLPSYVRVYFNSKYQTTVTFIKVFQYAKSCNKSLVCDLPKSIWTYYVTDYCTLPMGIVNLQNLKYSSKWQSTRF